MPKLDRHRASTDPARCADMPSRIGSFADIVDWVQIRPTQEVFARGARRRPRGRVDMVRKYFRTHTGTLQQLQAGDDPAPIRAMGVCRHRDRRLPASSHPPPERRAVKGLSHSTNFFRDRDASRARDSARSLFANKKAATSARLGAGVRDRRDAYSSAILLAGTPNQMSRPVPGVRDRPRHRGDSRRARGAVLAGGRRRRLGGAAAPLLHARERRLSRPHRGARDHRLRAARRPQGLAVLAHRPRQLPQPPHLPESRGAGRVLEIAHFALRPRRAVLGVSETADVWATSFAASPRSPTLRWLAERRSPSAVFRRPWLLARALAVRDRRAAGRGPTGEPPNGVRFRRPWAGVGARAPLKLIERFAPVDRRR